MIKKLIYYWLPALLWMGLIYFLSSFHKLQASPVGWQDFIVRKTAHFMEFAFLSILFFRGFKGTTKFPDKKRYLWSLLLAVSYALSDEFHQTFVNGRSGRFFDFGVDSFGALAGLLFLFKFVKLFPDKIKKLITF